MSLSFVRLLLTEKQSHLLAKKTERWYKEDTQRVFKTEKMSKEVKGEMDFMELGT